MNNVPPSVRKALKDRGYESLLQQEGEYSQYKGEIDKILHGEDKTMFEGYEKDVENIQQPQMSPDERKANERIEDLGDKYSSAKLDKLRSPGEYEVVSFADPFTGKENYTEVYFKGKKLDQKFKNSEEAYDFAKKNKDEKYSKIYDLMKNNLNAFGYNLGEDEEDLKNLDIKKFNEINQHLSDIKENKLPQEEGFSKIKDILDWGNPRKANEKLLNMDKKSFEEHVGMKLTDEEFENERKELLNKQNKYKDESKSKSDTDARPNHTKLNDLNLSDSDVWNMAYKYIGSDKLEKLAEKLDLDSSQDIPTSELLSYMSDDEIKDMMIANGLDDDYDEDLDNRNKPQSKEKPSSMPKYHWEEANGEAHIVIDEGPYMGERYDNLEDFKNSNIERYLEESDEYDDEDILEDEDKYYIRHDDGSITWHDETWPDEETFIKEVGKEALKFIKDEEDIKKGK